MIDAYVGLGANLGDAIGTVRAALAALPALPQTQLAAASPLYRTPAWGRERQPDFINAVARLRTSLPAQALLQHLLEIERRFGRQREPGQRWGPRTLDLDLLLYGRQVIDAPGLQVPHPHLHERAFALVPLADLAPALEIPGHGAVRTLLATLDAGEIVAIGG
ncbi:2-amino-4-hydroxy-6-hydroxymethyldihydropteridine diphosphokinase [Stenotrophomonas sp. MMGLT7]|uniref:2-amino-4-hydroxy-6- hydroxymethyldihydropteridine diphosphokinase n=1 Tax=Stenotrophomonas sp. MMGLT7 TaxID=2901227 RepID=UPI001E3EB46A|nr:2-amino-4-hydroxy-6-hydroxymethyldihydropteridine diphosphokinase [Stenotrophomonas sp. MMGLT7]MCD7097013.1 2-amino-4-hydroxy-6-hydroxymethyldihydropteridine diphosphokinase [Stenotrophomonas sp. MMGLT7]